MMISDYKGGQSPTSPEDTRSVPQGCSLDAPQAWGGRTKTCPLSGMECRTDCGWNTGKGCAVALLPRKLEDVAYEIKNASDVDFTGIENSLDDIANRLIP